MYDRRDPTLSELLDEPIIKAVMARDGISRESIHALIERVRRSRVRERQPLAA